MPTSAVAATQPTAPTAASTAASTPASLTDAVSPEAFLQLLAAQLKGQNPMDPMDANGMLTQIAQINQTVHTAQQVKLLEGLSRTQNLSSAGQLVGREVTWSDPVTGVETSGRVDSARLSADGATLTIGDTVIPIDAVMSIKATTEED